MMALGVRIVAALHFADSPPVNRGGVSVLFIAGDYTTLAADALLHGEMEAVLLAFHGLAMGEQKGALP